MERYGPDNAKSAAASSAARGESPRWRASARMPTAARTKCTDGIERVVEPRAHDQVQPGERVEDLGARIGEERLAKSQARVPHRPGPRSDRTHEAFDLGMPYEMDVTFEVDPSPKGLAEQPDHEPREETELERRSRLPRGRTLPAVGPHHGFAARAGEGPFRSAPITRAAAPADRASPIQSPRGL